MLEGVLLAAFVLVGSEKSATVVIPENAEPSTLLCVEELTNYVAKITGKVLPVGSRVPRDRSGRAGRAPLPEGVVVIGTLATLGDAVPAVAKAALEKSKKFEAGWMGTVDGNLWIVGKEETADMYLTYHFLESKLGVRWFQAALPEDPGDWYPIVRVGNKPCRSGEGVEGLVVEDFQEFREPDFVRRELGQQCSACDVIPYAGKICGYRNGFQFHTAVAYWSASDPEAPLMREHRAFYDPRLSKRLRGAGGHHTCYQVFPPQKYLKTNPELFALQNGVRGGGNPRTEQYCLSNPRLIEGCVKYYVDFFRKNGGVGVFGFGQTDASHGWCECADCRKLDGPGEDAYGNSVCVSSRIAWFANQLFEGIRRECPEVEFNFEPYAVFRHLPSKGGISPERVLCQYSPHNRCYTHRFDNLKCPRNAPLYKEMMQWRERLPYGLWTYEYFTDTMPFYVCHELMEAEDLKLYKRLGMVGWYNEGFQTGASWMKSFLPDVAEVYPSNWQWIWLAGHLLWDADQDPQTLLEDAESKYYGVAYPAMKRYHALRRKLWASHTECMGYPYGDPIRPVLLNAEGAQEELLALLNEADKLAAYDKVLRFRLSRDRFWLNQYWIKANEKARYEVAHALNVPELPSPVVLDGDPTDAAWKDALDVSGRLLTESDNAKFRKDVPDHLTCTVRVAMDGENLYFCCEADEKDFSLVKTLSKKKDDPVWGDDCFEIMLFPPAVENCYYHIAVNSDGVVYDSRCPGNDKAYDLGVEAKAARSARGWCVELRVPSKNLHPLVAGDKWRMQMGRALGGRTGVKDACVTLGGYLSHDTGNYPTFRLGRGLGK